MATGGDKTTGEKTKTATKPNSPGEPVSTSVIPELSLQRHLMFIYNKGIKSGISETNEPDVEDDEERKQKKEKLIPDQSPVN